MSWGLLDVDSTKAQDQINQKKASGALGYSNTRIFKNLDEALPHLRNEKIDLAILGIPPHFRGSILPDADFDLRLIGDPSFHVLDSRIFTTDHILRFQRLYLKSHIGSWKSPFQLNSLQKKLVKQK